MAASSCSRARSLALLALFSLTTLDVASDLLGCSFSSSLMGVIGANAHMQMSWPYPLHSTLNPDTPEDIRDYSMTSPLALDGSQYPCKSYINSPSTSPAMDSVITYAAGDTITVTIVGTAVHGGGSCQFMMSYDDGESWNVIQSYMGGCIIDTLSYDVTIPAEAPSGKAVFGWSWFNLLGNREMYQNCAIATITGGGSGLTGPTPFVANAGVNECVTVENTNVVFPDPGPVIVYGGVYASTKPTTPAGFTGSNCVGPNASTSGSSGSGSGSSSSSASAASEPASSSVSSSSAPETSARSSSSTDADQSKTTTHQTESSKHHTTTSTVVSSAHAKVIAAATTANSAVTSSTATQSESTIALPTTTVKGNSSSEATATVAIASAATTILSAENALPTPYIRFSCSSNTSFWDGLEGEVQTECAAGTVCLYCGTTAGTPCVYPGSTCDGSGSSTDERRAIAKDAGAIARDRQRRRRRMFGRGSH